MSATFEEVVCQTAQQRIEALAAQQQHAQQVDPQQDEIPIIRLKEEKGHLIPDAIVCAMTLAGECEIAPERCGCDTGCHACMQTKVPCPRQKSSFTMIRLALH